MRVLATTSPGGRVLWRVREVDDCGLDVVDHWSKHVGVAVIPVKLLLFGVVVGARGLAFHVGGRSYGRKKQGRESIMSHYTTT